MEVSQIPPVRKPSKGVIRLSLFLPKHVCGKGWGVVERVLYSLNGKDWVYFMN